MITNFFKFHPVGQGGFYSGHINYSYFPIPNNSCNFVFDCGTISLKDRFKGLIHGVKKELINYKLDILFISHLDDDHVNGLKFLIPDIRCEYIYLPYLTPFERLYVLARHESNIDGYDDYIKFIVNPVEYINSIDGGDIGQIVYIRGNNSEGFPEDIGREPPKDPSNFNSQIVDQLEADDDDYNDEMKALSSDPQQKVVFKKANGKLICGNVWEFFLFHIKGKQKKVDEFIKELNALYEIDVDKTLSLIHLEQIAEDKGKLKILRTNFKKHFKNINKTGLVVQHKPINYNRIYIDKNLAENNQLTYFDGQYQDHVVDSYSVERYNQSNSNGVTLLTGDIDFKTLEQVDYIKSQLEYLQVFQVSHHGSANGWSNSLLKKIRCWTTTAVINFGYGNTYGHPKPEVLEDLLLSGCNVKFCSQFDKYDYRITLNFNR